MPLVQPILPPKTASHFDYKRFISRFGLHLLAILASVGILLPLLLMVSSAFKNEMEIFGYPITIIPKQPIFSNFKQLIFDQTGKLNMESFPIFTYNSIKLTFIIVVVQMITAATGAYAFSKLKWKGRDALFLVYISSIMIPAQMPIIPQFIIIRELGLFNTHLALILLGSFTAFGTFLIKQYFLTIPDSFLEAARIDGANEFYIFTRVMLPLAKPVLAVQVVFAFRFFWNDFFTPLIYLNDKKLYTIPLGMTNFTTEYFTLYGPLMAACLLSVIPVLVIFLAAQKYFVQGIATGGIKG